MEVSRHSDDELAPVLNLSAEHIPDQLAGLFHFWERERAINLFAFAARAHHAGRLQNGKVLRYVSGRDSKFRLKLRNCMFSFCEQVENTKPRGIREGLADPHLHLVNLIVVSDLHLFCHYLY